MRQPVNLKAVSGLVVLQIKRNSITSELQNGFTNGQFLWINDLGFLRECQEPDA